LMKADIAPAARKDMLQVKWSIISGE